MKNGTGQCLKIDGTGLKQVKELPDPWIMPKDGKFHFDCLAPRESTQMK